MTGWGRKESAAIGSDVKPTAGEGGDPLRTDRRITPVKCRSRLRVMPASHSTLSTRLTSVPKAIFS